MDDREIPDPQFRDAVAAIDAGDVSALERLLAAHPRLLRERAEWGEPGYFHRPQLLWFVAGNPVRHERLPANVVTVTRAVLDAAQRERVDDLPQQIQYTLGLVASGRVPRECGVQRALIDLLVDAGADPAGALVAALAHRELDAVARLLERGAPMGLLVAACLGREADVARLAPAASTDERRLALAGAAMYGQARVLPLLLDGVDVDAYSPAGFHANATALHHAVSSGALDAVRVLVDAGAALDVRDRLFDGTPRGWAEYLGQREIADWLRAREGR